MGAEYDQRDARGFINLIGLPIQVRASLSQQKAAKKDRMKLWGGRFEEGPSEVFERFSGSLHFDRRLIRRRYPRLAGLRARAGTRRHSHRGRSATQLVAALRRDPAKKRAARRSSKAPTTKTSTRWSSAN